MFPRYVPKVIHSENNLLWQPWPEFSEMRTVHLSRLEILGVHLSNRTCGRALVEAESLLLRFGALDEAAAKPVGQRLEVRAAIVEVEDEDGHDHRHTRHCHHDRQVDTCEDITWSAETRRNATSHESVSTSASSSRQYDTSFPICTLFSVQMPWLGKRLFTPF